MFDIDQFNLESMSGAEFEFLITNLFIKMGYHNVINRQLTNDNGIDVEITDPDSFRKIAVQCKKRSKGKKISRPTIQLIDSAFRYENFDKGMIVTNTNFTGPARKLAQDLRIELIDDTKLRSLLAITYGNRKNNNIKSKNEDKEINNKQKLDDATESKILPGKNKILREETISNKSDVSMMEGNFEIQKEEVKVVNNIVSGDVSVNSKEILNPNNLPLVDSYCRYCDSQLRGKIYYCTQCQWPLASIEFAEQDEFIPNNEKSSHKYCNNCGTLLQGPTEYCKVDQWHFNGPNHLT